jgi:hypothetical protein
MADIGGPDYLWMFAIKGTPPLRGRFLDRSLVGRRWILHRDSFGEAL